MKRLLIILFVIMISLSVLIFSIEYHTFNIKSYEKSYEKYDLFKKTNNSKGEFLEDSRELIEYIKGGLSNDELAETFNEKEVLHMEDVQNIYTNIRLIKYICMVLIGTIILYFYIAEDINYLIEQSFRGLLFNYGIVGILIGMILVDFSKYFVYFHLILFDNDLWILDPKTDLLIQMMPESFFVDMAIKIGLTYIIGVIVIQIILFGVVKLDLIKNK